jgi:threonine/homoserine/homoserine lactone efflux protein
LFFLALFTAAIPTDTSLSTKAFYGIYLASATGLWFCFLSYITNFKEIRYAYQSHGHWFDRLMGIVLILMAIILLWT